MMQLMARVVAVASMLAVSLPLGGAFAAEVPRPELRINAFVAPLLGTRAGKDMPAYMAYSRNTRFPGDKAQIAPRDMVSNTVTVPRSEWGNAADDWDPGLGVIAGSLSPMPLDDQADSFYAWSGVSAGSTVTGGDDIGNIKFTFTDLQTAAIPVEPTSRKGALTWEDDPRWTNAIRATTIDYSGAVAPDGTGVRGPAARFTRSMYVNHVNLFSEAGDVDATAGPVSAPAYEITTPVPDGTVMNLQLVGYQKIGPWANSDIAFNFNAGTASSPSGEWRLPVTVTAKKGSYIPERRDSPDHASPQFTIPFTALGLPLAPDEAGPGANDVALVADVSPGDDMVYVAAIRRPDGSIRTERLDLAPGRHLLRLIGGRLVELPLGPRPGELVAEGDPDPITGVVPEVSSGAGAQAELEPPPDSTAISVNEEGRPVALDAVRDGKKILDSFEIAAVVTPEGRVPLGTANRDGRPILWRSFDGKFARANAAYIVGESLVIVHILVSPQALRSYVETHSLDGEPHPISVEAVADIADGAVLNDVMSGPVTAATRLLEGEADPRLLVATPKREYRIGPLSWQGAEVQVRNRGEAPRGEALTDGEMVTRVPRPSVWSPLLTWPLWMSPLTTLAPAPSGTFGSVKVYRIVPPVAGGVGGGPFEETRDVDGTERFGIAFGAKTADGAPISQAAITNLYISLYRENGLRLFSGNLKPNWSPDGGATWGTVFYTEGEIAPGDVWIYARATHPGGVATREGSPDVPYGDWAFGIDRMPLNVLSTAGGVVRGTTTPRSSVVASIPELGLTGQTTADDSGVFSVPFDLSGAPGGDYEATLRADSPVPFLAERVAANVLGVPTMGDSVPDDEVGTATARIRHLPGGDDASLHKTGPPADIAGAFSFLDSRASGGVFDGALRPTALTLSAMQAHDVPRPEASGDYLRSLQSFDGFAWRPGGPANATASGLGHTATHALGAPSHVELKPFMRFDGGAEPEPGADVSSIEATARLVLALSEAGELGGVDPWTRHKMGDFLHATPPASATEAYLRSAALAVLGRPTTTSIEGPELDALSYRAILGQEDPDALAVYQTTAGGFTLKRTGDRAEALPTALALLALRGSE